MPFENYEHAGVKNFKCANLPVRTLRTRVLLILTSDICVPFGIVDMTLNINVLLRSLVARARCLPNTPAHMTLFESFPSNDQIPECDHRHQRLKAGVDCLSCALFYGGRTSSY